MRTHARSVTALLLAVAMSLPRPALADGPEDVSTREEAIEGDEARLRWDDARHSRWGVLHMVGTAAVLGLGLGLYLGSRPSEARWTERNGLDEGVRDGLVLSTRDARETVAVGADALFLSSLFFPIVIDAILVAGLIRGSEDVALQVALISSEGLALGLLMEMLSWQAARERPFVRECGEDPDYAAGCASERYDLYTSFAAGHTLMTFASAGVVCANHTSVPLYGHEGADVSACVGAIGLATSVAFSRLLSDRHYLTDSLVGAGVGLVVGWLVPVLLHYHPWSDGAGGTALLLPGAPGAEAGLSLVGTH